MAARLEKYEEAEQINRRALDVREKVLGTEYPDTLTSVGILASVGQTARQYAAGSRRGCVPSITGCSTKSLKRVLARL
ncbi:hypothetical protein B0T18DRAFT_409455 [Schizothecium vesticola]|uniref:Kinesin light chain n=1 Tax=Schizothecium vesticola TaxID=314040 RepID=A0AA40ETV3_9PEZI|nr:hypothetical protein B0T18DRAFT_409455 [Schizothecium vesticola]